MPCSRARSLSPSLPLSLAPTHIDHVCVGVACAYLQLLQLRVRLLNEGICCILVVPEPRRDALLLDLRGPRIGEGGCVGVEIMISKHDSKRRNARPT